MLTMTNSLRNCIYVLHTSETDYGCVESFKLYGGPLQPFEYLTLDISKKRLSSVAPMLMDDIRAGSNIITLYGFGQNGATYVVTNCKKNGSTWKITAYATAEEIRAYTLTGKSMIGSSTDAGWTNLGATPVETIIGLVEPAYVSTRSSLSSIGTPIRGIVMYYRAANNQIGTVRFSTGASIWLIISICAMCMGCNVWVSNNILYVVDLSIDPSEDPDGTLGKFGSYHTAGCTVPWAFIDRGTIYLNAEGAYPYTPSPYQTEVMNNVLGTPAPGQEGRNLIKNNVVVTFNENYDLSADHFPAKDRKKNEILSRGQAISGYPFNGSVVNDTRSVEVKASQSRYGIIQSDIKLDSVDRPTAQRIADTIANEYCDSEQPITFTMRETSIIKEGEFISRVEWAPYFSSGTRFRMIIDYSNDLMVSAVSNLDVTKIHLEKGALTGWVRNFPEHTTTYTFGEIAPTDMTQNNSVIHTAIGSGGM